MLAARSSVVHFLLLFIAHALAKDYHPIPTYFHRLGKDGKIVDANSPYTQLNFTLYNPRYKFYQDTAALKVHPFQDIENGQAVNVSWAGVTGASEKDYVAVYCPPDAIAEDYLDYFYVTVCPNTFQEGFGSYQVELYNLRSNCEFRYYRNDWYTNVVAKSNHVSFRGGPDLPLQGHISLTGRPSEMRIMWVTGKDDLPVVYYGLSASNLTSQAKGSSHTYNASDMCGPPASTHFINPGFIHDVLLTGLKPGTVYYYSYGSTKSMSDVKKFRTAPVPGADVPVKAIIYGDMGLSKIPGAHDVAKYVREEVENDGAELVFHIGDISYARGYAYIWDQWHELIEPIATAIPYMVGIGNHEQDHETGGDKDPSRAPGNGFHPWWGNYGDDSGGECGVPMFNRFHMPENGNHLWWYSYDYGSIHFIMMSTEHDYRPGSRQYKWLEQDLSSVNRSRTPWVVLGGHRPMYTTQIIPGDIIVSIAMRHYLEDLLLKYKVDMAFWAHYHSYERICAVYKEQCTKGAPVHIVVGTAGYSLDHEPYWPEKWSMYHDNDHGYGRLTAANSSALHWEWVRNKDKVVADQVWVLK